MGLPGPGENTLCAMGHRLVEAGHWELFALTYRVVQQLLADKGNLDLSRYLRKLETLTAARRPGLPATGCRGVRGTRCS